MSDADTCQEAIVVIGEASESEDENSDNYKSGYSTTDDSKSDSNLNLASSSLRSSLNSNKILADSQLKQLESSSLNKKLSIKEDHFSNTSVNGEINLINEKLMKDNRSLRNAIINFGTQRYEKTIDELNELNQNLIKSHEKIQNANQYLEKTKCNLYALNDNFDKIFKQFNDIKLIL